MMRSRGTRGVAAAAVKYLLLALVCVVFAAPLLWMISCSLKSNEGLFVHPAEWIPKDPKWSNYREVMSRWRFGRYFMNTLITSLLPVIATLVVTPMVAYSITMIPWKGARIIFPLVLVTMMLPGQVMQVPLYVNWQRLGMINTFVPLVLPFFFGTPYYIYLMHQYMRTLPGSIVEAARIDGAGDLRILYQIVYPLTRPVLTTVAVLVFIACWNDFADPLIYLHDSSKYTLAVGLKSFIISANNRWELLMAADAIFTAPLVVIFFLAQKRFLGGISTTSGIKQ